MTAGSLHRVPGARQNTYRARCIHASRLAPRNSVMRPGPGSAGSEASAPRIPADMEARLARWVQVTGLP